ncbi:MAG: sigma-70 family RNA polymerase sigma factor [Actinomycetota bacterium]|nr:sigma-70 family RNA polymerase sigma factor [Actinomycetota bacterium]
MSRVTEVEPETLWAAWRVDGEPAARQQLVTHYLPIVDRVARRMAARVAPSHRADLHGFGVLGLLDAIDKFRPELGCSFDTYGSLRVAGAMQDGLRTLSWVPRASRRRLRPGVIESVIMVDFQTGVAERGVPFRDCISDGCEGPNELAEIADDHREVKRAIAHLPALERKVIMEIYYGKRLLKEIALDLDVTESRVCQIHRRALRMLESRYLQRQSA